MPRFDYHSQMPPPDDKQRSHGKPRSSGNPRARRPPSQFTDSATHPPREQLSDAGPATLPPDAQSPWVLIHAASPHPFIFKRMVRRIDPAARPGDIVHVYDKQGALFGRALFSPRSQIALRMLAHGDIPIDESFWRDRLAQALDLRRRLHIDESTDAYRLVHAEGDGLSGLIIERYADTLVFEVFSIGMYQRCRMLADLLMPLLGKPATLDRPASAPEAWRIVIRADDRIEEIEGFRVSPEERRSPGPLTIREHGVRFRVDVAAGHKTGFFCDQRDNRRRFARFCEGREVLDLCCYTAGFGIGAKVLGRAADVTSVDLDEKALEIARHNANLNQARVNIIHSDAFIYLRQLHAAGRRFDCLVCDPPKFAQTRDDLEAGLIKYNDLNALALQVVRPGGIFLTCSCSGLVSRPVFMETLQRAARRAQRQLQVFDQTGAAPDHPVLIACPESEYLKAAWCRVL